LQKIYIKGGMPGSNPLANILVIIVGAIVITLSLVLGFFAFLAVSAAVLIAAVVIAIRSWWLGRNTPRATVEKPAGSAEFIEGEFHVVKQDKNS
jgi:hypothetical protein